MRRTPVLVVPAAVLALALAACTGDGQAEETPEEVLAAAKQHLDETSGVRISLRADRLPDGVVGVTAAEGVGVHPAAFEGSFDLVFNGMPATVEVVAVDDATYAKHPLVLPEWTEIDPQQYGAPDPASLIRPDNGLSGVLTAVTDPEEGESVRGGADNTEILTEYTGVVPGDAVQPFLPSASGDFDAVFTVTEEDELREAELTGEFYAGADPVTYTITLSDYGLERDITAP